MKIIILGDGLLGSELRSQTDWNCVSRKNDSIDANSFHNWETKLNDYDVVINCIAYTKTYENDYESNWNINVKFVNELIDYCNKTNKKLVHISTDYVYAGSVTEASETDVPVHIQTWYGYSKLVGDSIVQLRSNNFLVCRLSHKPNPFPYEFAWTDIKTNCDYVNVIAELIIKLIKSNASGVYNVGTEIKSIYDLAVKTNENVKETISPDAAPKDVSINITKLKTQLI